MHARDTDPAPIAVLTARTPPSPGRMARPVVSFPAVAMAMSLLLAALGGLSLGVMAATQSGTAGGRWAATVQAHADLQLWGWFAVFIVALVFEFIVRLNGRPPVPVGARLVVLLLFAGGAVASASGRLLGVLDQILVTGGATLILVGALLFLAIVLRIPPARPLRVDLHPLFFRTGAVWLLVAAGAGLVASTRLSSGVASFDESQLVAEFFIRGFVINVIIAVALRAFPGHLGLPHVPAFHQRILWVLLNGSVPLWAAGTTGFGVPGVEALQSVGDLLFATALVWATGVLRIDQAVRAWRHHPPRAQLLVPLAWGGLVTYVVVIALQAVTWIAGGAQDTAFEAGAARHILMLGFVAPLFIAMSHVVLQRFLTGRLLGEAWLTGAFAMLMLAWPLRVAPPLLDADVGETTQALMGLAGVMTAGALVVAAAVAGANAAAAIQYERRLRQSRSPAAIL